jgi:hypothetical protein
VPRFETVKDHPFIVTTDGCKTGFAGILAQEMKTVLLGGKVVVQRHLIAYTSKRTSDTEEHYAPHLLEFAALKFSLDKFANMVWGQPVLLETDCSALHQNSRSLGNVRTMLDGIQCKNSPKTEIT